MGWAGFGRISAPPGSGPDLSKGRSASSRIASATSYKNKTRKCPRKGIAASRASLQTTPERQRMRLACKKRNSLEFGHLELTAQPDNGLLLDKSAWPKT